MAPSESSSPLTPLEIQARLDRAERAKEERPWRYYTPVPKIRDGFHRSAAWIKSLEGPNGGGKTWAASAEMAMYLTGYNHFRDETYPIPNVCWAICLDFKNNWPEMDAALTAMLPKGTKLRSDKGLYYQLPDPWKSRLYVKACESGPLKFQSQRVMAIWQDEEWPGDEGYAIFRECMRRKKPGWPFRYFITMTPHQGYTWVWDYISDEGSERRFHGAESFNFSLLDCASEAGRHKLPWRNRPVTWEAAGGFLPNEHIIQGLNSVDPIDFESRIMGVRSLTGGNSAFRAELIADVMQRCKPGTRYSIRMGRSPNGMIVPILEERKDGDLYVIQPPEKGRQYILGADPSMGVYRDRSCASVWDRSAPVEVAYFVSKDTPPIEFAKHVIAPLATWYNEALAVIESNSEAGGATLANIQTTYGNLYVRQDYTTTTATFKDHYGWHTTDYSRGQLFSTLKELLTDPRFIPSKDLLLEASNMILKVNKQSGTKRIDHLHGRNDDHLMAGCMALTVNMMSPPPIYEPWENYREEYMGSGLQ